MTADRSNLAPLAIFVCGIGYTLWPASETPVAKAAGGEAPIKLKERWFNPKLGPASPRDPFVPRLRTEATAAAPKTEAAPEKPTDPKRPTLAKVPPESLGLKLTAILVGPAGSAAVIEGKVLTVGERVVSNPTAKTNSTWEIVRVTEDRVDLVDFAGKRVATLTLTSDEPATASGAARPAPRTGSAGTTAAMPTSDEDKLREVLGPAASALSPLPPGIAESLGKLIGADLKNGDLGALESLLGSASSKNTNSSPVVPKGGP